MTKPRRKSDIRQAAKSQIAHLQSARRRHKDWRETFLTALMEGATATKAARLAGVSRSRIYEERVDERFDDAWYRVQDMRRSGIYDVSITRWPPVSLQRCR